MQECFYSAVLECGILSKREVITFFCDISKFSLKEILKLNGKLKHVDNLLTYKTSEFCNYEVAYEIADALYNNGKIKEAKELYVLVFNDHAFPDLDKLEEHMREIK